MSVDQVRLSGDGLPLSNLVPQSVEHFGEHQAVERPTTSTLEGLGWLLSISTRRDAGSLAGKGATAPS